MKIKEWLKSHIEALLFLLAAVQPILDAVSYWLDQLELSNAPTLLLRFLMLGAILACGFLLSKRRRAYYVAVLILLFLGLGHIYACTRLEYPSPLSDLTNYIRVAQLPIVTLCMISLLRRGGEAAYRGLMRGMTAALWIIFAVVVISVLTGTDQGTYPDGLGVIGWFSNSNSQSAILSVLVPVSLIWQLTQERRNRALFWATAAGGLLALYFFGTRLSYLAIYAVCIGLAICIFLARRKDWRVACFFLAAALAATVGIPYSQMTAHQNVGVEVNGDRQSTIERLLGKDAETAEALLDKRASDGLSEDENAQLVELLTPVYEEYVGDFVEQFGAERTMELYDYSVSFEDFSNLRHKKLMFARLLMEDSPVAARFFGIALGRFTVGSHIYDVENDFHGIFYLYGAVGLAALLLFLLYFGYLIARALLTDFWKYFTLEAGAFGISLCLLLVHVYCTAGVLRRPNASFYLSVCLAAAYYLVKIRKYPERRKTLPKGRKRKQKL